MKEIIKKFNLINDNKKKLYQMISDNTGASVGAITQRWFNRSQGIKVPTEHVEKVIEVLNAQLKHQKLDEINYNQFKK